MRRADSTECWFRTARRALWLEMMAMTDGDVGDALVIRGAIPAGHSLLLLFTTGSASSLNDLHFGVKARDSGEGTPKMDACPACGMNARRQASPTSPSVISSSPSKR